MCICHLKHPPSQAQYVCMLSLITLSFVRVYFFQLSIVHGTDLNVALALIIPGLYASSLIITSIYCLLRIALGFTRPL